jgi:ADP-heptose:LPS heptosyltransferase
MGFTDGTDLRLDCRHFPGDRPCVYHKNEDLRCGACGHYERPDVRVLLVKLDALGDVLRTTCLLPSLRRRYPRSQVVWLTLPGALPVLENHPLIDERRALGPGELARLEVERFDLVLSPDASKTSAALAQMAHASEKRGYGLDESGQVRPFNPEALEWLEMGGRDDLKRANRRTYQDHVHRICRLDPQGQRILVRLSDEETEWARTTGEALGLGERPVVGLNMGSSPRWPRKQWPVDRYRELIGRLRDSRLEVLLLGGPQEREIHRELRDAGGGWARDPGCDHSLRRYFGLVGLCDVVVTGDTLGLHAALGLGRRVVAMFGPTSPWEIDLYGLGEKIVPDLECVSCYRSRCDRRPGCMEKIDARRVEEAVERQLRAAGAERERVPALASAE